MTVKAIVFPECLSTGSRMGPGYRTRIIQTTGGAEFRSSAQSKPRYRYDARKAVQTLDDVATLLDFMHNVEGSLYGFLFTDPIDHSTASDHRGTPDDEDVLLGAGDASETQFQLRTKYVTSGETKYRTITKPKSGTVVVAVDGAAQTLGVDFTVDTNTGIVTFEAGSIPAGGTAVTAGCEFYVPVRFEPAVDQWMSFSVDQVLANVQSIGIVELPDTLPVYYLGMTGGAPASVTTLTATSAVDLARGRVQRFQNSTGGALVLNLPAKSGVPFGGPILVVGLQASATGNLTVTDVDTATTITTLTAGDVATFWMTRDASGNREWLAA